MSLRASNDAWREDWRVCPCCVKFGRAKCREHSATSVASLEQMVSGESHLGTDDDYSQADDLCRACHGAVNGYGGNRWFCKACLLAQALRTLRDTTSSEYVQNVAQRALDEAGIDEPDEPEGF